MNTPKVNNKILVHFQNVDPILYATIGKFGIAGPSTVEDYFADLVETIICQQLSEKAGATIFGRFKKLFPKEIITPQKVLKLVDNQIRAVGTSGSKVGFIKNLARAVVAGEVRLEELEKLEETEVKQRLMKLKGIGPWTAEMFLMFSLGREDIFSYGDVGLQRAIKQLYRLKKDPTRKQMETISNKWRPYRTYACRVLWRSLDNKTEG